MANPASSIRRAMLVYSLGVASVLGDSGPDLRSTRPPSAPPEAPGTLVAAPAGDAIPRGPALHGAGGAVYSIGDPTDEEQLYVEYINRARADPVAEGRRFVTSTDVEILASYAYFKVDLALLGSQFNAIAPAPPLSIDGALTTASRRHARDMLVNAFQGHDGTDGSDVGTRATDAGYPWTRIGENVYARALGVWHGHAGFNVDWGIGPGGIQDPPGHRNSIHNASFREIGVGVTNGIVGDVGPQVVAQALAERRGSTPFVTGVVYYDFNGNQFYDLGEGLGGVTVRVSGTATRAVTARSGGYSVPVSGDGSYSVTFEVPGREPVSRTVTVAGRGNVKVDHLPAYTEATVQGPSQAPAAVASAFASATVGGATAYEWRTARKASWTEVAGAEGGPGSWVAETSPGYGVIDATRRRSGQNSFRLTHAAVHANQYLTLPKILKLGAGSTLGFWSCHTFGGTAQTAKAQISTDDGRSWVDLWSQVGKGDFGEADFAFRDVSLAAYAGRTARFRFAYLFGLGSYLDAGGTREGFFVDDIAISGAEELTEVQLHQVEGGSPAFTFTPPAVGGYSLEARGRVADRALPWGPAFELAVVEGTLEPPRVRMGTPSLGTVGVWEIPFAVLQGTPSNFQLHGAARVDGPWSLEAAAVFAPGAGGSRVARVPAAAAGARFFRIQAW